MNNQKLLETNIIILKLCSMYPYEDDANFLVKTADLLYKVINILVLYFLAIPCVYETTLGEKTGGITSYAMNIVMICAYGCSTLTLHFFHFQGKGARDLIVELNKIFKYKSDGEINQKTMEPINQLTRKLSFMFTLFLDMATVMMALFPLFSSSGERFLPVPGVYPFPYKQSPTYEIIYAIQVYAQVIVGSLTSAGDILFICMLFIAAEQFEILSIDFQNCLYNALLKHGIPKEAVLKFKDTIEGVKEWVPLRAPRGTLTLESTENDKLIDDNYLMELITSENFNLKLKKLFTSYIRHHQVLLTFCMHMENFFWPFILMKTAISMFYHIFITFALVTSNGTTQRLPLTQYELSALLELFAFACAGQTLITKSENLQEMLYSSPWYICNKGYKTMFHMVQMRSSLIVRLSVGKLYDMSLPTFLMVMKTAFSYLAVLRQMTE